MQKVLIIGGDARYLEVIDELCGINSTVYLIGYANISFQQTNIISLRQSEVNFTKFDAIILPVHGTTPTGKVTSTYSDENFSLTKEMIDKTPEHCVIYTGTTNDFLNNATKNRKLEVIFARDDVAIYNAIPTAEATLQLAIDQTDTTVHGSNVIILGFGRVGFTVARLFSNIGANVTVCVRKSSDIARITEMGMNPILMKELKKEINNFDICINTIPQLILDAGMITEMHTEMLVIDLASAPGGTDFDAAKNKGITALHALGLPGKTAPKTAGKIIAETIISLMNWND